MTLDEAIKHAEEVADAKLQDAELSEIQGCYNNAKKCVQCAKEHRQLAEWLKDYKRLKKQEPCDVLDINVGNIYGCPCGYGWDKSKVVRHHFCPNCGRTVDSSYNSIKPELKLCEDAISRQAVMDCYKKWQPYMATRLWDFEQELSALPSVISQQRTGHWEWVQYDYNPQIGNWQCSECRCIVIECGDKKSKGDIPLYKYCPQCGCRIVELQESEGKRMSETKDRGLLRQLQDIADEICNHYCKYPDIWDDEKEGCELSESEHCQNCPLNRL